MAATNTKDRLLIEAMRLFGEQGYQATRITQIEAAAGLAPGSGALYHHFKSKDALLEAGIDRQLDRRHAMRDIRTLFAGLGDLRIELTMLGRYLFNVLDEETQLLKIAARTPAEQSQRLDTAYAALIEGLTAEIADWIHGWTANLADNAARATAAVAVDALLGRHITTAVLRVHTTDTDNEAYVAEWTAILAGRIDTLTASG